MYLCIIIIISLFRHVVIARRRRRFWGSCVYSIAHVEIQTR